jgi:hypothetical protein
MDLPERLARFATHEAAALRDKRVWGVPTYGLSETFAMSPVPLGDRALFEEHGTPRDVRVVPLASLGREPAFLTVRLDAPHAVGLFQRGARDALPMWPSLDAFLASLVDVGQPSPMGELGRVNDEAEELLATDALQAASLLERRLRTLRSRSWLEPEERALLGRSLNLLGVAAHRLGAADRARGAFEEAQGLGDKTAAKNLRELFGVKGARPAPKPKAKADKPSKPGLRPGVGAGSKR